MEDTGGSTSLTSFSEVGQDGPSLHKFWMNAIETQRRVESEWRDLGDEAEEAYVQGGKHDSKASFNLYYSSVETILPAIYNSPPVPDVRRRFGDRDPVAKMVADILDRIIRYNLDMHSCDEEIEDLTRDQTIPGRGVMRVVMEPASGQNPPQVYMEHWSWRDYCHGPAKKWKDVQWQAYGGFYSKDTLANMGVDPAILEQMKFNATYTDKPGKAGDPRQEPGSFKMAYCWQVWDKASKNVFLISEAYNDGVLANYGDPYGLEDFFPNGKPLYGMKVSGDLVPQSEYKIIKPILDDIDSINFRLRVLTKQMRVRGLIAGGTSDVTTVANLEDGEFLRVVDTTGALTSKGLDGIISFWPIDKIMVAIDKLQLRLESAKVQLYEVSGIADIMRGATDPKETLGAQQIKTQWGSLRVQKKQARLQGFLANLFEIMAELISKHFEPDAIVAITGIGSAQPPQMPPELQQAQMLIQQVGPQVDQIMQAAQAGDMMAQQQMQGMQQQMQQMQSQLMPIAQKYQQDMEEFQTFQQAMQLMKGSLLTFKVDVETDSTVRGDLARNMQAMTEFVTASGNYWGVFGQLVQVKPELMKPAVTIYTSFCRQFRLGREVDATLDGLMEIANAQEQQMAQNGGPPVPPEVQVKQQELQLKKQELDHKMEMDQKTFDLQDRQHADNIDLQRNGQEMDAEDRQAQREQASMQFQQDQQRFSQEQQMKQSELDQKMLMHNDQQDVAKRGLELKAQGKDQTRIQTGGAAPEEITQAMEPMMGGLVQAIQMLAQVASQQLQLQQQTNQLMDQGHKDIIRALTKPKSIRTPDGRVYTSETDPDEAPALQ